MNTHGKNGQAIGHAYGQPMATPMARYGTVRNGTVRHQDSDENPSVPDAAGAVDNPKFVRFLELDDIGWSGRQIAKELRVSERTITRWRAVTGRAKREPQYTHPPTDRERAAALIEDGAPFEQAAAAVGVTAATIRRWFPTAQAWTKSQAGQYGQMSRRLTAIGNNRQRVEFDLPKPVWFELATIAQKRDTTVADLIADAIKGVVVGEQTRIADRDRNRDQIIALVKDGHDRHGHRGPFTTDRPGMANHQKETA